jgi:alanine dehydrogenase
MRIGIPREQHDQEHRVRCLPDGVATLILAGHEVLVELGAGAEAGVQDGQLTAALPGPASQALTRETLPYIQRIAAAGWRPAARGDQAIARGVNAADGVTCLPVGRAHGLRTANLRELLAA